MTMARDRSAFRQVDVTRAIKAARAAGVEVLRVEIEPLSGKIVIVSGSAPGEAPSPFDEWKARHAG